MRTPLCFTIEQCSMVEHCLTVEHCLMVKQGGVSNHSKLQDPFPQTAGIWGFSRVCMGQHGGSRKTVPRGLVQRGHDMSCWTTLPTSYHHAVNPSPQVPCPCRLAPPPTQHTVSTPACHSPCSRETAHVPCRRQLPHYHLMLWMQS